MTLRKAALWGYACSAVLFPAGFAGGYFLSLCTSRHTGASAFYGFLLGQLFSLMTFASMQLMDKLHPAFSVFISFSGFFIRIVLLFCAIVSARYIWGFDVNYFAVGFLISLGMMKCAEIILLARVG
ncbi:MAG: hypothetical protein ACRCUT_00170 [Spirochaetota bacterium]